MTEVRFIRDLFLRCVCVVFLFAFTSFYLQIPGLYGKNGILPARTQLTYMGTNKYIAHQMQRKPTLLWFGKNLGIETEHLMEILSLIGIFFAFTGFISQKCCTKPIFSALWSLYYSLYQVGQIFMLYQWDALLLEVGVICVLLAPWINRSQKGKKPAASDPVDGINLWLVRWLLFRLLFSSGVVKLTSGCPTWWGLTALNVHFESQCLPTPLAWYSHNLPSWFLKLNTVFANFAEILVPIFFFFPLRAVRLVAFWLQVFLQIAIILTGNYNFFNYLTIALCLSLLDDDFFSSNKSGKKSSWLMCIFKAIITIGVYGGLLYATAVYYGLKVMPGGVIDSKIKFTPKEFDFALKAAIPVTTVIGFISLIFTIFNAMKASASQNSSKLWKVFSIFKATIYTIAALFIFTDSLVPFSALHPTGKQIITPQLAEMHTKLSHLLLTNEYGLFRKMTGVGGRPEVIIEGANSKEGPWLEYHFKYKPGHVNDSLPFVAPHQPRLDWQMWFAALGTYHQNPWIMSLSYRILSGQKEVLALMDTTRNPFPDTPPKFLRANLYHYHYTALSQKNNAPTWTRNKVGEYFPIFSKDQPPLSDYLKQKLNIHTTVGDEPVSPPTLVTALGELRGVFMRIEPLHLLISLLITGFALIFFGSLSSGGPQPSKSQVQHQPQQKGKKKKN